MKPETIKRIDEAINSFNDDVMVELKASNADSETKYLCEQIARQVFYTLKGIKEALANE